MRICRKQRPAGLPGGASMAGREGIPLRPQAKAARHCMERTFRQGAAEEKSKIKQREMKRIATSVLGLLAMTAMLRAQIDFGGAPPSFRQGGAKAVSSVPVQKVEHHLDEVSLMEEEAEARLLAKFAASPDLETAELLAFLGKYSFLDTAKLKNYHKE